MNSTRKAEINRHKLLEAGITMFSQRGYGGVGLKEILQQVNVPKGSFYNYFESKEDYAAQVIDFYSGLFVEMLKQVIQRRDNTALIRFESLFDSLIKLFDDKECKDGCLVGDMATELADTSDQCRFILDKALKQFTDCFESLISQGQVDGSIRQDISASDMAFFTIDAWEGALIRMRLKKNIEPLDNSKHMILQFLQQH